MLVKSIELYFCRKYQGVNFGKEYWKKHVTLKVKPPGGINCFNTSKWIIQLRTRNCTLFHLEILSIRLNLIMRQMRNTRKDICNFIQLKYM